MRPLSARPLPKPFEAMLGFCDAGTVYSCSLIEGKAVAAGTGPFACLDMHGMRLGESLASRSLAEFSNIIPGHRIYQFAERKREQKRVHCVAHVL